MQPLLSSPFYLIASKLTIASSSPHLIASSLSHLICKLTKKKIPCKSTLSNFRHRVAGELNFNSMWLNSQVSDLVDSTFVR